MKAGIGKTVLSAIISFAIALFLAGCGGSSGGGSSTPPDNADPPAAVDSWLLTVDIDNSALVVEDSIETLRATWVGGHTVDIHNGPAGCLWNDTTDTLTCEIVVENRSGQCMNNVRTRFHDSTNPSAIMTGVDYVWPGPSVVPNTAQPIDESGYCITEASPTSAGSAEGCSHTWQDNIPPGAIASQYFVFTNVPAGQYMVYLEVFADYYSCAAPAGMARAPAGCFHMGDFYSEGNPDELPVHPVCITSDFFMDLRPVTNAEFKACVDAGACAPPGLPSSYSRPSYYGDPAYDNFPVIYVDWDRADAYCAWAGKRLPAEAEYEYAGRGGLHGDRYLWGDSIAGDAANFWDSGDPWDNDTSEAGHYGANGYGLYDMAGNVWEWTADRYLGEYYASSPADDPRGPATGDTRVVRGGSWSVNAFNLRVSNRLNYDPAQTGSMIGFRCASD